MARRKDSPQKAAIRKYVILKCVYINAVRIRVIICHMNYLSVLSFF